MMSRLEEAEAVRMRAKQQELEDEISRKRAEQARQAETARVLAETQLWWNLQGFAEAGHLSAGLDTAQTMLAPKRFLFVSVRN